MAPDDPARISRLYHEALLLGPGERAAYVARACGDDLAIRQELESLLAQDADGFLAEGVAAMAAPMFDGQASSLSGRKLGGYTIGARLGAGGMGEVYRARDRNLDREVALKILPRTFSTDPERLARFEREARVLAALNHPHIAVIYGIERFDGVPALVLELVEGGTLATRLRRGPLSEPEALRIARQMADALEAAHDKGIVHRDLKPSNVALTPDGTVKLLDFGLAKTDTADPPPQVASSPVTPPGLTTGVGVLLGTAAYMSPEQAKGLPVDRRADIWAFGAVLFELLVGRPAFSGDAATDTIGDVLARVIEREPEWAALPSTLPSVVHNLLGRCLEKDPRRRLQAIGEARIALDDAHGRAIGDSRLLVESGVPPKKTARHLLAWAAAAVLGVALLAVNFVRFRSEPAPDQQVRFQIQAPEQARFGNVFSLSPDGRQLTFTAIGPKGESMLWIRPLDAVDARPLHGTEGAAYVPFWSPDSRYLAFGTGGKLEKIDVSGGPPQVLCDAPPIVTGGTWSPTGEILFSSNAGHAIWKVSASGGAAAPVTKLADGDAYHVSPQFLPDGHHFIYSRLSQTAAQGVYVGSIDLKPEEQDSHRLASVDGARYATAARGEGGYLLFLRERTLMAQRFDVETRGLRGDPIAIAGPIGLFASRGFFAVSANGVLAYRQGAAEINRLTWLDRTGKAVGYVAEPGRFENVALSPEGSRLAVERPGGNAAYDIWLTDLARATNTRFTFGPGLHVNPVWSPDGKRIAYAFERNDGADVFQKDSNGTGAEEALFHYSDNAFRNTGRATAVPSCLGREELGPVTIYGSCP